MATWSWNARYIPSTPRRCRTITLISAENLPDIRTLGRMKVYAVVSVNGQVKKTEADTAGKTNPRWNCSFQYFMNEPESNSNLVVEVYCKRSMGDRFVCKAEISLQELVQKWQRSRDGELVLELHDEENSTPRGKLNISHS